MNQKRKSQGIETDLLEGREDLSPEELQKRRERPTVKLRRGSKAAPSGTRLPVKKKPG